MDLRRLPAGGPVSGLRPPPGGILPPPAPRPRPALVPNATLAEREDITPNIARLVVRPDSPVPPFRPGQYFSLGLTLEAGPILRPYSTASHRGSAGCLEFLVRRVPFGALTPTLWNVAVGDRLWIGPPKGLFTLKPGDDRTHLLISAGTGIAPFMSMLPELADRPVVVAHGVSYQDELAYRVMLESLAAARPGFVYAPTVSRPYAPENAGWSGLVGRVERVLAALWVELDLAAESTVAYLCGNPEMVEASRETLLGLGIDPADIVHENYWAATAPGVRPALAPAE